MAALVCALLAVAALAACRSEPPAAGGPIILISLDTLRADMLGVYGYQHWATSPTLDRFAAESVVFNNAIVTEPRTLTSHMSLLTGRYPQHHQVEDDKTLPEGVPTLATLLGEAGYRTYALVDDGYMDHHWGFDRGFDSYEDSRRRGFDSIVPEAIALLQGLEGAKTFLFLHTYDIHSEGTVPFYDSPEPFRGMFSDGMSSALAADTRGEFEQLWERVRDNVSDEDKRYLHARYAEGVRHVDERLKELFDALQRDGIYDRALIVVWGDHGEGLFDHDSWGHGEVFDHTIRVPLMMKLPGGRLGGTRIESPVSTVDIAPTILQFAGHTGRTSMDGTSLLPLLDHDRGADFVFTRRTKGGQRLFSIRSERYHLIWDGLTDRTYFFDLDADPREMSNLSPSGTEMESAMRDRLSKWVEEHDRALETRIGDAVEIDPELTRKLRALGYLR